MAAGAVAYRPRRRGNAVVVEGRLGAHGVWAPQLPGCVAVGATGPAVERLMERALALHVASLREHGERAPRPTGVGATIIRPLPTGTPRPAPVRAGSAGPVPV